MYIYFFLVSLYIHVLQFETVLDLYKYCIIRPMKQNAGWHKLTEKDKFDLNNLDLSY